MRVLVVLAVAILAGCASIKMSEEQRMHCRSVQCYAVTEAQLEELVQRALELGYKAGVESI